MTIPISVIVLTKNSEAHLARCLCSLSPFDQVVICDNGSEDGTLALAATFANVTILRTPFIGFGPLRRLATEQARHDWILAVDSDEVIPTTLREEIAGLSLDPQAVYAIPRRNHFAGKPIRCCGWSPDWVVRLFNRTVTGYNDHQVHESVEILPAMRRQKLQNSLDHFPFADAKALIDKMQYYSDLYAAQYQGRRRASAPLAVVKALAAFLKNYLLKGGFWAGAEGLLISVSNANGVFYKYMKLRERNRMLRHQEPEQPTGG